MSMIRQAFSFLFYTLNTIFWFVPIFICGVIKPHQSNRYKAQADRKQCATMWVSCNSINQNLFASYKLNVTGLEQLKAKDWYLVIVNDRG